jgi:hypothetical protein
MDQFAAFMKSVGFKVDPGMCGSRGMYFITSYIPRVAHERKGWRGRVEQHTDADFGRKTSYQIKGRVQSPNGDVLRFDVSGDNYEKVVAQVQAEFFKHKLC